jgi:microcystin-dependent protein
MGQPYVGEIRLFAGTYAPLYWHFCDGSLIPISENTTLYNLIGTIYGGDGVNTFGLPNLLGRVPIHQGTLANGPTFVIGQSAGVEEVTLTTQQMPSHSHPLYASTSGQVQIPSVNVIPAQATSAATGSANVYSPAPPVQGETLHPVTIGNDGMGQPHTNIQPYVALNYIISLYGIYPSQN